MAEGTTVTKAVQTVPLSEKHQGAVEDEATSPKTEEAEASRVSDVPESSNTAENENVREDEEENRSQNGNALLLNVTDDLTPLTDREPQLTATSARNSFGHCTFCGRPFKRCVVTVCLTVTVALYVTGGGFLFSHLESNRDISFNGRTEKYKNDTAILLATELRQVSPYEDVWARTVFHYLDAFERDILRASYMGYRRRDDPARGKAWTFRSAVFFSISLMTTTGYGSSTPHSEWSRTIVLGYSAVGIPLTIAWLIVTGSTLAIFWSWLFDRLFCHVCHKNHIRVYPREPESHHIVSSVSVHHQEAPETNSQSMLSPRREGYSASRHVVLNAPSVMNHATEIYPHKPKVLYLRRKSLSSADHFVAILFSGVLFIAYFVFGSTAVAITEGWSIADSVYFNFVMFATIGPGCQELEAGLSTQRWEAVRIRQNFAYSAFIMVGFCLLSMFGNLVYNFYRYRRMKHSLKRKKWLKLNVSNSLASLSAETEANINDNKPQL